MENLFFAVSVWTCLALLLLLLFSPKKKQNLPPGPIAWPLVGSLFAVGPYRHRSFAKLAHKYGPIMFLKLGSRPHLILSNPAAAKEVLKDHDVEFANRPQYHSFLRIVSYDFSDLVFASVTERWKMLRRVSATELFTPTRVSSFSSVQEKELAAFASSIHGSAKDSKAFDLSVLLHELFTNLMTGVLFGRKFYIPNTPIMPEAEGYRAVWDTLITESERFYIGDYIPALRWIDKLKGHEERVKNKVLPAVEQFLSAIVEEHRKDYQADNPRDFVDVMLSLNGQNKLDNQAVIALLQNLLIAGTETSKATLEWGITQLIRHPEIQKRAHEELDNVVGRERSLEESDLKNLPYLQAIMKEVLRFHPPAATGLPHYNKDEVQVAGYTVPAGTTVLLNIWAIQHDPATWKDPETFRPERFLNTDHSVQGQHFDLLPFSSGRRRCVGLPLALPHITFTLSYLLHRFEWRAPPGMSGKDMDMEESTGLVASPAKHRIVCASARTSLRE